MPRTEKEIAILNPVAVEAGRVTIEWNDMCESFGVLFARILYPSEPFSEMALAVWHSTISDSLQRDMLMASARVANKKWAEQFPKFYGDICQLCEKAKSLSDHRNNVAHAPLTFSLDEHGQATGVVASTFFGHPRAQKLDGKDLIAAFRLFTDYAEKLKLFARQIDAAITFSGVCAWPERPDLPSLAESAIPRIQQGRQIQR